MDIGLFKYPGGNGFLDQHIISIINDYSKKNNIHRYVEPFVGSGRAFYTLLTISPYINSFWINDIDPAIAAIWTSCIKYTESLIDKIENLKISQNLFHKYNVNLKYHDNYKITKSLADVALKKLFIHQNSYLGLGEKTKKPLIHDECWNTNLIINRIKNIKNNSDKIFHKKCFNNSCFDILKQCSKNDFIYLDPPFYHNSETMFKYSFKTYEHLKLSNFVRNLKCPWIMSYDDCVETRTLYKWAYYKKFDIEYYIYGKKYAKKELLISSGEKMLDILKEQTIFD